ncbi:nitronate monooxygenase [Belnapia sp. T6]|uniref:Nitronate monooxygenase n=1 Tax=Belnapia mucosa TaxID=2804532 RepID=A0ABS1VBE5_9PROT|nr:nitronate monooxygenase family protein [Belnapia mucosa]MBL6457673.1 nitronate monooxygenase [Belnapia mucosa]
MNTRLCRMLGIGFPLLAFSHCRDVVAAVSRAGGFGVFGAAGYTPEELEQELRWIDAHADGRPYGVDLLVPENLSIRTGSGASNAELLAQIPSRHRDFVGDLLRRHGVDPDRALGERRRDDPDRPPPYQRETAERLMDVAFGHPIRLIANALGVPPASMMERARAAGIPCAALVGARDHALRQVEAGVDILVAQGGEAGGHCGEVSTMVLVPEVLRVAGNTPVLAAGGIMTGRQMAGCMAMGAAGVWTGSVWLATTEAETSPVFREKMVAARSRDTVRSRGRTGKPARQLRSAWTEAWEGPESPGTLPMPLQGLISEPAMARVNRAAEGGDAAARELVSYFVGQGVGLVEGVQSCRAVVEAFMGDFAAALEDMQALAEG